MLIFFFVIAQLASASDPVAESPKAFEVELTMEAGCSIWFSRPARALARKRAECRRLLDAEASAIEDEAAAVKREIDRLLKLGRTSQEEVRELGATIRRSVEGSVANIYSTFSVFTTRVENIVRYWLTRADIDPVENEYEFIKTRVQVTSSLLSFESNRSLANEERLGQLPVVAMHATLEPLIARLGEKWYIETSRKLSALGIRKNELNRMLDIAQGYLIELSLYNIYTYLIGSCACDSLCVFPQTRRSITLSVIDYMADYRVPPVGDLMDDQSDSWRRHRSPHVREMVHTLNRGDWCLDRS
jgi:hypothetical protein